MEITRLRHRHRTGFVFVGYYSAHAIKGFVPIDGSHHIDSITELENDPSCLLSLKSVIGVPKLLLL